MNWKGENFVICSIEHLYNKTQETRNAGMYVI